MWLKLHVRPNWKNWRMISPLSESGLSTTSLCGTPPPRRARSPHDRTARMWRSSSISQTLTQANEDREDKMKSEKKKVEEGKGRKGRRVGRKGGKRGEKKEGRRKERTWKYEKGTALPLLVGGESGDGKRDKWARMATTRLNDNIKHVRIRQQKASCHFCDSYVSMGSSASMLASILVSDDDVTWSPLVLAIRCGWKQSKRWHICIWSILLEIVFEYTYPAARVPDADLYIHLKSCKRVDCPLR